MNNKTSIFVYYALLVVVGFSGTALLGFTGKSGDTDAVVTFLGFYGFLCTTGSFYVIGKQNTTIDSLYEYIRTLDENQDKNCADIYRHLDESVAARERDVTDRVHDLNIRIDSVLDTTNNLSRKLDSIEKIHTLDKYVSHTLSKE